MVAAVGGPLRRQAPSPGQLLGGVVYSHPSVNTTTNYTNTGMAAIDATNVKADFTVPPSGQVDVEIEMATAPTGNTGQTIRVAALEGGATIGVEVILDQCGVAAIVRSHAVIRITSLAPGSRKSWTAGASVGSNGFNIYNGPVYGTIVFRVYAA